MSAKKNKANKKQSKPQTVKAEIDYEKLAHAIASALIQTDSIRKKQEEAEQKQRQERLALILGEKECPKDANKVIRRWYKFRNDMAGVWHFLWLKKEDSQNTHAATALAQLALEFIFLLCEWFLYITTSGFVCFAFFNWNTLQFRFAFSYLPWAMVCFFFARFFRLARFEVDNLRDKEYLIALLSGVASFLAMVFTLIGLFK